MVDAAGSILTRHRRPAAWTALRAGLRFALHRATVAAVIALAGPRGAAPCAVFLPSRGREMSSLLRIYMVAAALKRQGWQTAVVPWRLDLDSRHRILSALRPDVVVMQGARHPLNRPELYPGARIAYDMDDADFHLDHLAGPVREAMPQVELVLAGSRYVTDWCRAHGARAEVVWTGTPVSSAPRKPHVARGPVVVWAQTAPATYHRERAFVLDVMRRVRVRHPDVRLRLCDRRPGEPDTILEPFRAAEIAVEWQGRMGYGRFLRSLGDVAVGLSPVITDNPFSRGKSFGKILAYLDRGVPVVAGDAVDHPLVLDPETAVLSNDPALCADAVCRLLDSPAARQAMADRGHARLRDVFAPERVAAQVDAALCGVLGRPDRQATDEGDATAGRHAGRAQATVATDAGPTGTTIPDQPRAAA